MPSHLLCTTYSERVSTKKGRCFGQWTAYDFETWLAENKTRFLHNADGSLHVCRKDALGNTLYIPDLSLPEVRAKWVEVVANTGNSMDGVFVDRGDIPGSPGKTEGIAPAKAAAWRDGHVRLIHELRAAMADKIYLLNDHTLALTGNLSFPAGFDHEYEHFTGSIGQIQQLQNDSAAGALAAVHSEADFNTTLAAFLLGAGNNAYFAKTFLHGVGAAPGDKGWSEPAWDGVRPEYNKKLGAPLGPAVLSTDDGQVLSRRFKSGTRVTLGPRPQASAHNHTNSTPDSLGFIIADINNVAGQVDRPTVFLAGKMGRASECESRCATNATCLSYTWCGPQKGSYAHDCYLRSDTVWRLDVAHKGTTSGCKRHEFGPACHQGGGANDDAVACIFWADGSITGSAPCHNAAL